MSDFDRKMRKSAKEHNWPLVSIHLDDRHVEQDKVGMEIHMRGAMLPCMHHALFTFLNSTVVLGKEEACRVVMEALSKASEEKIATMKIACAENANSEEEESPDADE